MALSLNSLQWSYFRKLFLSCWNHANCKQKIRQTQSWFLKSFGAMWPKTNPDFSHYFSSDVREWHLQIFTCMLFHLHVLGKLGTKENSFLPVSNPSKPYHLGSLLRLTECADIGSWCWWCITERTNHLLFCVFQQWWWIHAPVIIWGFMLLCYLWLMCVGRGQLRRHFGAMCGVIVSGYGISFWGFRVLTI